VSLLAVTNALGVIFIFISLTLGVNLEDRQKIAKTASFAVALILLMALLTGE